MDFFKSTNSTQRGIILEYCLISFPGLQSTTRLCTGVHAHACGENAWVMQQEGVFQIFNQLAHIKIDVGLQIESGLGSNARQGHCVMFSWARYKRLSYIASLHPGISNVRTSNIKC